MNINTFNKQKWIIYGLLVISFFQLLLIKFVILPNYWSESCYRKAYSLTEATPNFQTLNLIQRCASYDPKNYRYQALAASFLYGKKLHKESLTFVMKMLEIEDESFEGKRLAALNYEALSDQQSAITYRMAIWMRDPLMIDNNYMLINLLVSEGRRSEAIQIYDDMRLVAPESEFSIEASRILGLNEDQ